jgi:hypothetical protein
MAYRERTIFYYDWMIRDFFAFMLQHVNGSVKPAGIAEQIPLGNGWESKCRSAHNNALTACVHEHADEGFDASWEWRKIFGSQYHLDFIHSLLVAGVGA